MLDVSDTAEATILGQNILVASLEISELLDEANAEVQVGSEIKEKAMGRLYVKYPWYTKD